MVGRAERAKSFGAVADDYDRLRPGPPDAAVDWLLPERCQTAVDLGAGTGLLARALARKVPRVIAVEPDARMRAVLAGRSPGAGVLGGTGEAIPLAEASVDGVFVSSAWHWMDPDRATAQIARVLRDRGRFACIWTGRDHAAGWLRELARPGTPGNSGGPHPHEVELPEDGLFTNARTASFRFTRRMTVEDFLALHATYSRVITASPGDRATELARLRAALADRFPGAAGIDVPMRSRCWRADRAPRQGSGSTPPE